MFIDPSLKKHVFRKVYFILGEARYLLYFSYKKTFLFDMFLFYLYKSLTSVFILLRDFYHFTSCDTKHRRWSLYF